jgi:hypothetical protein
MTVRFASQAGAVFLVALNLLAAPLSHAAAFSDFDNDGRSDILWRHSVTGENYVYPMQGTAILGGEGYLRAVPDANWQIVGIGNFDGQGGADILWRNDATGENYIYLMSGNSIVGEGYIRTVADRSWRVVGVGDFNGDGKDDILWRRNLGGENYVYLMDGTTIAGEGYIRTVANVDWQVVGVGDFDGDSKSDILWRNVVSGENYIYLMDGLAIKTGEGYVRTVPDRKWQVAGVADFDGDGKHDILWRNDLTGQNYIYLMDGTAIRSGEGYLRTIGDPHWQVAAVADYDGDGKADILWRHGQSGQNYLYPMNGVSILPGEGYTRTVAQSEWIPIGRSGLPPVLLEALPITLETAFTAASVWTGAQEVQVPSSCGGDPEVNCSGGTAGPPAFLALTRPGASISQTSDPAIYSFSAQVTIASVNDIPVRIFGQNCSFSIDTTAGASRTVQVQGTAAFGRYALAGAINRFYASDVQLSGLTEEDVTVKGGDFFCNFSSFGLGFFVDLLTSSLQDSISDRPQCGAPGAGLLMTCPIPPEYQY